MKCYFSRLSSTSSTLLGPWKPYPGGIDHAFRPSLDPSRQNKYRPAATVQLLTKKRSIFLSLSDFTEAMEFIFQHKIRIPIDTVAPLSEGIKMIKRLEDGQHFGKIVLKP